jgi:vancomycin resistance protein VanJ
MGFIGKMFLAGCNIYAGVAVIYLLVRLVTARQWWPVALLDNGLPFLLLPSFILLIVMLARRHWLSGAVLAPAALAFVWMYGGLFLPGWPAAPTACASGPDSCELRLRVMVYNTENSQTSPDELIPYLRGSGADIIALSELTAVNATHMRTELADLYPYQVSYGDDIPGIGLISRYPITTEQNIDRTPSASFPHVNAELVVNSHSLSVLNVHPIPPAMERTSSGGIAYQVRNLPEIQELTALVNPDAPTLMLGDFNMVDQNTGHDIIASTGLRDAFREAGWGLGLTWPADRTPLVRIDYIWISPHFHAENVWTGEAHGGDHLPVIADLVWTLR